MRELVRVHVNNSATTNATTSALCHPRNCISGPWSRQINIIKYPITLRDQFVKITSNQLDQPLQKSHNTALPFVCSHSCSCITNFSHL